MSRDNLYLKPGMPLGRFCRTVNYKPKFPYLHRPEMVCDVTMTTRQSYIKYPNPLLRKTHLTNVNLYHFKMIEAMGLKMNAWKSP
jgi:hypothetical protein